MRKRSFIVGIKRQVLILGGAMVDRCEELIFRIKNPPQGRAHLSLEITPQLIEKGIDLGSEFIAKHQSPNGSFRGFLLYPGASTGWFSAHLGFVGEDVPQLEQTCEKTAKYLHIIGKKDGGWRYNRRVGFDCDSTAQALMVLHRFDLPIEDSLIKKLLLYQSPCGGFSTYRPQNRDGTPTYGWQVIHPDVSILVAEVLRRIGVFEERFKKAACWLSGCLVDGVLPAYWWEGPSYGLWAQSRTGFITDSTAAAVQRILPQINEVPKLPMVLTAAIKTGCPVEMVRESISLLLSKQCKDGSWVCGPCLRVTNPNYFHVDMEGPGKLYADYHRLFSTAHSVAALTYAKDFLFST